MTIIEAVEPEPKFPPDPREFRLFLLCDLVVDANVQRATDPDRVNRIKREFTWLLFEVPTVVLNEDGDTATVVEAQHRVLALKQLAPADFLVMCAVLPPLSIAEQAGVAYSITKGRRTHSSYAKWELRYRRGDPHEVAAEAVLDARGLRLGGHPSALTVAAVETVSGIVHWKRRSPEQGAAMLADVLDVLGEAFLADEESRGSRWDGRLMKAVASLLTDNPNLDQARLVSTLRSRDSEQWLRAAQQPVTPAWLHLRAMFVQAYNTRRGVPGDKGIR